METVEEAGASLGNNGREEGRAAGAEERGQPPADWPVAGVEGGGQTFSRETASLCAISEFLQS